MKQVRDEAKQPLFYDSLHKLKLLFSVRYIQFK